MKKLTFIAGLLIILGGAIYGVLYFDKISVAKPFKAQPIELPNITQAQDNSGEYWINFVPDNNELPYAYPATELSVRFDFASADSAQALPSAISIDNLDEYKFACVKQVLAQNNIESAYYKSGSTLKLMVFIKDKAMYERLLADLRYYRLNFDVQ